MRKPIPDYIIDKAVDIWCKALHNPQFDNGANELSSILANALSTTNCEQAQKKTDMDKAVEKFRKK